MSSGSGAWEAEERVTRLRAAAERVKERVTGPANEGLVAILAELQGLESEKKAAVALAKGLTVLADDLEDAA